MKRLKSIGALVAFVVAATVAVGAWSGSVWVEGGNDPALYATPYFGLWTNGVQTAEFGEGATYVQVKTNGYGGSCQYGFPDGSWCADNAHVDAVRWRSFARHKTNVVPYGTQCGTTRFYVGGNFITSRQSCTYFPDPPTCNNQSGDYSNCGGESPIIIATGKNKNNYSLTHAGNGVLFDIDADGVAEQVSWTKANSDVAFLALDRNGNGTIDDGSELFGNHTMPGVPNGFAALRETPGLDGDGDVDADDALFASLLLWHDRDHDGISQPDELTPAASQLEAIGLGYTIGNKVDGAGNAYRLEGWARDLAGDKRPDHRTEIDRDFRIYDVYLVAR